MPPSVAQWLRIAAVVAIQIAALAVMWQTEYGAYGMALYLLAWIALNCFFSRCCEGRESPLRWR